MCVWCLNACLNVYSLCVCGGQLSDCGRAPSQMCLFLYLRRACAFTTPGVCPYFFVGVLHAHKQKRM